MFSDRCSRATSGIPRAAIKEVCHHGFTAVHHFYGGIYEAVKEFMGPCSVAVVVVRDINCFVADSSAVSRNNGNGTQKDSERERENRRETGWLF